ncbi:olfactory receptor 4E2-like [Gastrophryne carolinensis]
MWNQTSFNVLVLSGLSDLPSLQLPLFLFFLLIYLLTLTWNLLIIILIVVDAHLHTPMYFFLGNLASLDLCCSSVTVPRMLFDLHTRRKTITTTACLTQVFFFLFFASSEVYLLAFMSYDRYIAICRPLHYMQIMNWQVCVQLASSSWFLGFIYSLFYTVFALRITFCDSNVIEGFFCDLPQLFQISCSDIFINVLLVLTMGGSIAIVFLVLTFLPYFYVFRTVQKMQVKGSKSKVLSTCSSHLTIVFIFYGSCMFNYLRPNAKAFAGDKTVSVFYSVVTPLLNPQIYSLRNQDFRAALQGVAMKIVSTALGFKP